MIPPSSPPAPRSQIFGSSDVTTNLTYLDRVAGHMLESLIHQSPKANETSRLTFISTTLTTILCTQEQLGLPPESPAIITTSAGSLVAASWANGIRTANPGEPSVIVCLRIAAQASGRHQLDDLGYTLHIIGSVGHFDAPGAIYNFGPSYVHLVSLDGFTSRYEPVAPNFWDDAMNKRGMGIIVSSGRNQASEVLQSSEAEDSPRFRAGEPSLTVPPCPPQPDFLLPFYSAWSNRSIPLRTSPGNGLSTNTIEAHELMGDLHRAASRNVIEGGGPFAAAVISPQGNVLSFGVNRVVAEQDAIAHGEVCALREARRALLQDNELAQPPDTVLSGYSVITSSITCISCAEQLSRYGIKRLYYDNSKDDIERNTPFTEGPLRRDFWERTGILVERIPTEDALRLEPFRLFSRGICDGTVTSYLKDKAR